MWFHGGRTDGVHRFGTKERSHSPDEEQQFIDDDENDDTPTGDKHLWLPVRNQENTMFERSVEDTTPTKKYP